MRRHDGRRGRGRPRRGDALPVVDEHDVPGTVGPDIPPVPPMQEPAVPLGRGAPPPADPDPWGMCQAVVQAFRPVVVNYSDRVARHRITIFPGSSDPAALSDWAF